MASGGLQRMHHHPRLDGPAAGRPPGGLRRPGLRCELPQPLRSEDVSTLCSDRDMYGGSTSRNLAYIYTRVKGINSYTHTQIWHFR